ncbi:hypothetical protein [Sphingomonas solaris]|uniref:Uncharacterized protein n=1 Tax=Alterirhizorhabdus solaris TaxID=2529389 RepID=A0A558RD02_9SPHN|nr:hypothetical protein [Sphingomonas solaris]TVV77238.1 hypothetical protein FOY91_01500 [Sphingomonas solaris]
MSNGISISVGGGNGVAFGNVIQGDGATITAGTQHTVVQTDAALADACEAIDREGARQPNDVADVDEIERLKAELAILKKSMETARPGGWASFGDTARAIYEKYGWAAMPLKKLFGILIPGWLPA